MVNVQTGRSKLAVNYMAGEQFIGWAPRGSEILFTSARAGTTDLWSLAVDGVEPKGSPKLLKANLGEIKPIGIANNGAFFYRTGVGTWSDLYVTSVDFRGGKVLSAPKFLRTLFHPQRNANIHLSKDSKFLFFCSGNPEPVAYMLDIV